MSWTDFFSLNRKTILCTKQWHSENVPYNNCIGTNIHLTMVNIFVFKRCSFYNLSLQHRAHSNAFKCRIVSILNCALRWNTLKSSRSGSRRFVHERNFAYENWCGIYRICTFRAHHRAIILNFFFVLNENTSEMYVYNSIEINTRCCDREKTHCVKIR